MGCATTTNPKMPAQWNEREIVLAYDMSGSMQDEIDALRIASKALLDGAPKCTLYGFDTETRCMRLDDLARTNRGTNLTKMVKTVIKHLNTHNNGDVFVLVVSDGEDADFKSDRWRFEDVDKKGRDISFAVLCVGERCAFNEICEFMRGLISTGDGSNHYTEKVGRAKTFPMFDHDALMVGAYKTALQNLLCVENHSLSIEAEMQQAQTVEQRRQAMGRVCIAVLQKALATVTVAEIMALADHTKQAIATLLEGVVGRSLHVTAQLAVELWDCLLVWMQSRNKPLSLATNEEKMEWTCRMSSQFKKSFATAHILGNTVVGDPFDALTKLATTLRAPEGRFLLEWVAPAQPDRCIVTLYDDGDFLEELAAMLQDPGAMAQYATIKRFYEQWNTLVLVLTLANTKAAAMCPFKLRVLKISWEFPTLSNKTVREHERGVKLIRGHENINDFHHKIPVTTCPALLATDAWRQHLSCAIFDDTAISPKNIQLGTYAALVQYLLSKGRGIHGVSGHLKLMEATFGPSGCAPDKQWNRYVDTMLSDQFMSALTTSSTNHCMSTPDLNKAIFALLVGTTQRRELSKAELGKRLEGLYMYFFECIDEEKLRTLVTVPSLEDFFPILDEELGPALKECFLAGGARLACEWLLRNPEIKDRILRIAMARMPAFTRFDTVKCPDGSVYGPYQRWGFSPESIQTLLQELGADPISPLRAFIAANLCHNGVRAEIVLPNGGTADGWKSVTPSEAMDLAEPGGWESEQMYRLFRLVNSGRLTSAFSAWFDGAWTAHILATHAKPMEVIPPEFVERYYAESTTPLRVNETRLVVDKDGLCKNACASAACPYFCIAFGRNKTGPMFLNQKVLQHIRPAVVKGFTKTLRAHKDLDPQTLIREKLLTGAELLPPAFASGTRISPTVLLPKQVANHPNLPEIIAAHRIQPALTYDEFKERIDTARNVC